MKRLAVVAATTASVLALSAGPSMANPHDRAEPGFVGPAGTPIEASDGQAGVAHQGIQCLQDHGNPHLGDLRLECSAH